MVDPIDRDWTPNISHIVILTKSQKSYSDVNAVRSIIEKYDIRYVVVGRREHSAYENVILPEMTELFELAFPGEIAIYRVRSGTASEVSR